MIIDELTIYAKAGNGGNGVVRWRHEKFKPLAGPAGGNGGHGGDVYVRAVKDLNQLAKYTGKKSFVAESGVSGANQSQHGANGQDLYIDVPVGSRITDVDRQRTLELNEIGQIERILKGGGGGLGNEHFKSAVNQSPEESTKGKEGEAGNFLIEVVLMVDVGIIGLPNAGKSTLLNNLTNATSKIGSYPFTTLEPHLGDLYGFILADIPGLIEGAAAGKGLGHKFLRHVSRTKMLLHVVSLENDDPLKAYYTIRKELSEYDEALTKREEWIILSKNDLVEQGYSEKIVKELENIEKRVLVVSQTEPETYKKLREVLVSHLQDTYNN